MDRNQFTFYDSFFKSINRIKKTADRCRAYDTICGYALHGTEPDMETLPDAVAIAFELVRPNLDASMRKSRGGKKGKPNPKDDEKIDERYSEDNEKIAERQEEDSENKNKNKKEIKKEIKNKIEIKNECLKEISKEKTHETPKPARHRYGQYGNVLLSDEDLEKLQAEFPDWQARVERLSEYIASTGKSYKNHLATIRTWARKDAEKKPIQRVQRHDEELSEFEKAAVAKLMARHRGEEGNETGSA